MPLRHLMLVALFGLILSACGNEPGSTQVFSATLPAQISAVQLSPTPSATATWTAVPATETLPPPSATPAPTQTPAPQRVERFAMVRPIRVSDSSSQRDYVDRTYPYGDTQGGTREVHTGMEFVNPRGTSVLAAADGRVVFAGTDSEQLIGPRLNYFGNVIIIEHPDLDAPGGGSVYTLYGHLERILVVQDGVVQRGMPIAEVGDSGIAIGPHLHFEVRLGDDPFDISTTVNPDLWIRPYPQSGILAGRIIDAAGQPLPGLTLDIRSSRTNNLLFAFTYGDPLVNGDPAWQENFTRGDLPIGQYSVTLAIDGDVKFQQRVNIEENRITWLDIVVE